MAYTIDPLKELLRAMTTRAANLLIRLSGFESPLSPGGQVRFGKALAKLGRQAEANGCKRAKLVRGKCIDEGVTFTRELASISYELNGDVIRERYPRRKYPDLYKPVNHREKVRAEVGPLGD